MKSTNDAVGQSNPCWFVELSGVGTRHFKEDSEEATAMVKPISGDERCLEMRRGGFVKWTDLDDYHYLERR